MGLVILAGGAALVLLSPTGYPQPILFGMLLLAACWTSAWKVNLPIPLTSGSTLSVAYAANLMTLMLLGPSYAVIVAVAGTWTQCRFKPRQRYPVYRTVFSAAAVALTMAATGIAYAALGGPPHPADLSFLSGPLVGAITTCFLLNTGLIAGAIALSTGQAVWKIWHDDFLWGGASFFVAGTAGAVAAVVIQRGQHWNAVLMAAPIYLTHRTYRMFVGRLEDQNRHLAETRRLHNEALAARSSAEQANQLKDQFLAVVSHELRTPLTAILGWADMLRRRGLEGARLERAARVIFDSARRQAQLIDELLDVSRIMSGKLRLEAASVDVRIVVRSAVEVVQPAAEAKGIRIEVDATPALGTIDGDSARLQQVVWNLLSNAVKFTCEGGFVRVRLREADGFLELAVIDSGLGISREFLPFVFEPFRQADGSTTRPHGGLGLGLSITKHLVEAHRGTISADSEGEGRGSAFTVRLPAVAGTSGHAATASLSDPSDGRLDPPPSLAGLCVLVVDDDDESRYVIAEHLLERGASVMTAATAAGALEVLQDAHVDVLLADVAMPGEDGYSLIRKLRSSTRSTVSLPAAALTAFAREQDRERALEAGFQLHLAKPIDPDSLIAAVARLVKTDPT